MPLHASTAARSGGFLPYVTGYCDALVEAEDRPAALAVARDMVAVHGGDAHLQSLFAHVLWRNRRFDEALVATRRAVAMVPASDHYAQVVALYEYRRRPSTRLRKLLRKLVGLAGTPDVPPGSGR